MAWLSLESIAGFSYIFHSKSLFRKLILYLKALYFIVSPNGYSIREEAFILA